LSNLPNALRRNVKTSKILHGTTSLFFRHSQGDYASIEAGRQEIVAAVAWFTDRDIFEVLCQNARAGLRVSVVLIDDDINRRVGGLNFQKGIWRFSTGVLYLRMRDYLGP
jgi:hypothetical protein